MPTKPEDVQMPFGAHQGETLGQILADDPKYLDWLSGIDLTSATLRAAVKEMCRKYEAEIEAAVGE